MATYQIWADIVELAPDRFFVTVSAVPKDERTEDRTGGVKTAEAKTRAEANEARDAASHANERCLAGQRMRRVANGWVDAGAC